MRKGLQGVRRRSHYVHVTMHMSAMLIATRYQAVLLRIKFRGMVPFGFASHMGSLYALHGKMAPATT